MGFNMPMAFARPTAGPDPTPIGDPKQPPQPKPTPTIEDKKPKPEQKSAPKRNKYGFYGRGNQGNFPPGSSGWSAQREREWRERRAQDNKPKPKPPDPTPPPRDPTRPRDPNAPPPDLTGGYANVQGVNPVITPMFRHLFSPEDVARYGVRQPMQIPWAQFNPADPTRLDWLLGTMPNWWLPNQQIAWKPWVDEGDEDNED